MRILIPGHSYPDSFADNVGHTLSKLGHEVHTLSAKQAQGVRRRVLLTRDAVLRRLQRGYVTADERHALELARQLRPDMVLALTRQLAPQTLADLKKLGVRHVVVWWGDAPANMQEMGVLDDGWDAIFLKDHDCVRKLQRVGLNAHLLQEAHNPDWHRPVAGAANDKVVVAGNFYGFRQFIVRRLLDRRISVDLYGGPLPRWVDPAIASLHRGRYVVREEKSRVFGEGLACLNTTHLVEGNSLNCRAFEIAGAAGLQLIEPRPVIETCFEPGVELLTFDSIAELEDHLERARKFPEEARRIREAGHRRALAEHTYQHRLEQLLRVVMRP
jgi:spore maturation protein CgeB